MCGIAGIIDFDSTLDKLEEYIHLACKAIHHRGPDDEGYFIDQGVALGASRLAIRDRKHGMQPIKRNGLVIVFNGELYDTKVLKENLSKLGYPFETECDTEILLNAFLEFGPAILPKLVGMFAFAIWDSKKHTLYLARDRWGEKPLYYAYEKGTLAFASEIKGLKNWPHLRWETDLEALHIFLKNSYLPHPRTGWKHIFKLEPGSLLVWKEGHLTQKKYFELQLREEKKGTPEEAEELFQRLNRSVKQCAASDRPLGVFLSGGIDSTTVAYFLSQHFPKMTAFSLHWDDKNYNEELYTKAAASCLGFNHLTVRCDASFFLNHFDSVVSIYDEPFADESMVPTYCLAKFAKEKVDVVLTGDGADEFFHGYERYFFSGNYEKYLNIFAAASQEIHEQICTPDFLTLDSQNPFLSYYLKAKSWVSEERARSAIDIQTYLTDDILTKVDRVCMANSLENRAPFLTPLVTEFALRCSLQGLVGPYKRGKEILRTAMKDSLPKLILDRKKMGFGVPLNDWFRSTLKEWMITRLKEGVLLKTGWFSEKGIDQIISNHLANKGNYARPILNLLVLEAWLKNLKYNKHQ